MEIMADGMIGRIKWTIPLNKDPLKNNKNVLNAAGINRIDKYPTSDILRIDLKTITLA